MSKPDPCKHCGSGKTQLRIERDGDDRWFVFSCDDCYARTGFFLSEAEALAAWNRKPEPEPVTPEGLERLGFEKEKGHDLYSFLGMNTEYYNIGFDEGLDFLHIEHCHKRDCVGGLGVGFYVKSIDQVKTIIDLLNQGS